MAKKTAKTAAARKSDKTSKPGTPVRTAGTSSDAPRRQLPTDVARPSGTDDTTEGTGDDRPTAREGLRPVGLERPHPTAAARPGKTAGEATRRAFQEARTENEGDDDPDKEDLGPAIRVEATQMGYYDNIRRRTGDVFDVPESLFSKRWMKRVDGRTAPRTTTSGASVKREQDAIRSTRRAAAEDRIGGNTATSSRSTATGDANPLGADRA